MVCNLVKTCETYTDKKGKQKKSYKYFLRFDNGTEIPVEVRYYITKSEKQEDIDKFTEINKINSTKMLILADDIKK